MSVRSVREYLAGQLDNLPVPGITAGNIRALARPYLFDVLEVPTVFVWPLHINEERIGGPRTGAPLGGLGTRERLHRFAVIAMWNFDPDSSDPGQFDDMLGVIDTQLYAIPSGTILTDAVTGEVSTLMAVAEGDSQHGRIDVLYRPPKQINLEGTFIYTAAITVPAWEWLKG